GPEPGDERGGGQGRVAALGGGRGGGERRGGDRQQQGDGQQPVHRGRPHVRRWFTYHDSRRTRRRGCPIPVGVATPPEGVLAFGGPRLSRDAKRSVVRCTV